MNLNSQNTNNTWNFILLSIRYRFLKKLRLKQKENYVVNSIADVMIDFFSNQAEKLINAYGKWQMFDNTIHNHAFNPNAVEV